ncbi:adenylosuccinate synthase [Thermodesulfobacteriota bacterium]
MPSVIIVGTQWGDEGKGKIVDILTEQADVVVRFQGGPNAGHTVVVGDKQTILHQVPSGILHEGKKCVVGNGVVMDIETLINEIGEVKQQGYFTNDASLIISENAHLIMPYHKRIDIAREKMKGKDKIGTTGRGIGPAYEDKVGRNGIRMIDIFNDEYFKAKLAANLQEKNFYLQNYLKEEPFDANEIFDAFLPLRTSISKYVGNTAKFMHDALQSSQNILFEGAQGTMLDVDHGTYPFVTSSNTASAQAAIGSGVGPRHLDNIVGIAKAYTTRVGSGPFPTEQENDIGELLQKQGGEFGATTGRPRRCGWIDFVTILHSIRTNSITHLTITKMDVLSGIKTIKACVGYEYEGRLLTYFPTDFNVLEKCTPVYEEVEGWEEDLSGVTSFDGLPEAAKKYIAYIESKTGVQVNMISVGTKRDQIITLKEPFQA